MPLNISELGLNIVQFISNLYVGVFLYIGGHGAFFGSYFRFQNKKFEGAIEKEKETQKYNYFSKENFLSDLVI